MTMGIDLDNVLSIGSVLLEPLPMPAVGCIALPCRSPAHAAIQATPDRQAHSPPWQRPNVLLSMGSGQGTTEATKVRHTACHQGQTHRPNSDHDEGWPIRSMF